MLNTLAPGGNPNTTDAAGGNHGRDDYCEYTNRTRAGGTHETARNRGNRDQFTGIFAAIRAKPKTLFTNVHVFDGVNENRMMNANVLVGDNLIKQVSTGKINAEGATVINGGGRTLMPGLIDAH